jgi:transcriptional regulator with XRE-family HTH domain
MEKKKERTPFALVKVGEMIKTERKNQKLSLKELSEKSFGHPHYATIISLIERGKRPRVEFITITKILNAMGFKLI